MTIIDGRIYSPGNNTTGNLRGMGGRRFDIEYIPPSVHAPQRITTFDLWAGGELLPEMRDLFPDTARFLNNASEVKYDYTNKDGKLLSHGELPPEVFTSCWTSSSHKNDPYPLPKTLGIGV